MRREGQALVGAFGALGVYASAVLPRIDQERKRWAARAAQIPDPVLREQALDALREKSENVDATGVFATLAPRRDRPTVVRAGAALQIAVDYLDALNEKIATGDPADGLRMQRALLAAVAPGDPSVELFGVYGGGGDGGYLGELITDCARASAALPRIAECRAPLRAAVARCAEGQAYTHAAASGGQHALQGWTKGLAAGIDYAWWEVAAGASSSVAAHALIALAADGGATAADAERVDAAYFPSIGALTVLLDDLVDLDEDVSVGEHNYIPYYADDRVAAERLGSIAARARAAMVPLRRRGRHEAILAGVAGFYLAQPPFRAPRWATARRRLLDSLGAPVRVLTAFSRLRSSG
jgi:tetraprenyl-beta-curcumene synthase